MKLPLVVSSVSIFKRECLCVKSVNLAKRLTNAKKNKKIMSNLWQKNIKISNNTYKIITK
ncbi:MAG: hypothetical protein A2046_04015 [Bacteroidetes bacterium GWA2_30_7]|nr:MAG: hypothetical protein A2046_04015 [Bacteroidetes bacterium GWA2_30_7]